MTAILKLSMADGLKLSTVGIPDQVSYPSP